MWSHIQSDKVILSPRGFMPKWPTFVWESRFTQSMLIQSQQQTLLRWFSNDTLWPAPDDWAWLYKDLWMDAFSAAVSHSKELTVTTWMFVSVPGSFERSWQSSHLAGNLAHRTSWNPASKMSSKMTWVCLGWWQCCYYKLTLRGRMPQLDGRSCTRTVANSNFSDFILLT